MWVFWELPAKFCLHSFEWFSFQISSDAKIFFFSCPSHCDQGLIIVIVYYFWIWKKKEHIFSSRVISNHTVPMFTETPSIIRIFHIKNCTFGWDCRIHRLHLCRGVRSPLTSYDTKQSHGEASVMLELWGMQSTPSLSSLPGPLTRSGSTW